MSAVLHVLDHSLPEQSGYSSRSHAILAALATHGVDVAALTGPKQGPASGACEDIDGIRYWRTQLPPGEATDGIAGQLRTIRLTKRAIASLRLPQDVRLLHAHSPCLNGLAALATGLPVVYEMRSSWEDAAVSNGQTGEGSLRYRASRALETYVARRAAAVTVICDGLKRELISRGIPAERITVAPNALPDSLLQSADPQAVADMRHRFGLHGRRVIGFFGSFFEWEGVDALVEALPAVLRELPHTCLFLAGGGRQETVLRNRVTELGLGESVVFAGRLPGADVLACYGLADLMVFPRVSMRLTEMVTPLKPLEAMAQRVPVLASDVGGHRELIVDGKTGYLYPAGDGAALARRIVELLDKGPGPTVTAARDWVERERCWSSVARNYLPIYDRLLRGAGAPAARD